jgi:hypothetical protein
LKRGAACLLLAGLAGCASFRSVTANDGDFADYSAFRMAAHEGTRLARAQDYIERHADGAWLAEVTAAFEREEPEYFEGAKATRARTSDYLASLPRGPHAEQALALLTAFDAKVEDATMAKLVREARRTEAMLDRSASQRRRVGESILADVATLLDPDVYGARLDAAPPSLARSLGGTRQTWGRLPPRREEDLFFNLPTRPERESRVVTVTSAVNLENGRVIEARVEGSELFVRWAEADTMSALDPTSPDDRAAAADHAKDLLSGAFEARMPADRCRVPPGGDALIERACDGWSLIVRMSKSAGGLDAVVVRGPTKSAEPTPAK